MLSVRGPLLRTDLGTWQSAPGEVKDSVLYALKVGYRHIDAAYVYGNEDEVGAGLKEAFDTGVCKREDVFVTTKLWCTYHNRAEVGLEKSLKRLGLDYVDLFLMHWPVAMNPNGKPHLKHLQSLALFKFGPADISVGNHDTIPKKPDGSRDILPISEWNHVDTWKAMEKLVPSGKVPSYPQRSLSPSNLLQVKAIGVANYSLKYLPELLAAASVVPAANQIEQHPSLPQQEIVDFCKEKGIHITAYSPLGSTGSPMLSSAPVIEVARKRDVTPASVLLSYHRISALLTLMEQLTNTCQLLGEAPFSPSQSHQHG